MNSEAPASEEWTSEPGGCPVAAEPLCSALDPYRAGRSEAGDAWRPWSTTPCGNHGPFCAPGSAPVAALDAGSTGQSVLLPTRCRICGADWLQKPAALLQSPVPF